MYRHILLPTDGSERSERSIQAGVDLAKALNAQVTGVFVGEQTYLPGSGESPTPTADSALAVVAEIAAAAGVVCQCISMLGDTPQDGIVQIATEKKCDLIVMGTHGRSRVGKFFLGSTAAAVVADCQIPVLLHK